MFQSLIGTVQRTRILKVFRKCKGYVSISHRYGPTLALIGKKKLFSKETFQSLIGTVQLHNENEIKKRNGKRFQSLIGTVQQQYLLRFLFSLYPIFPVFQPFSSKKSANLFIANSRKALILLAFLFLSKLTRRFTDFSAVFFCFQHFSMLFLFWKP